MMEIELTKAQAEHISYILSEDTKECLELLGEDSRNIDSRYCRNSLNISNRILQKLFEKGVA